MEWFSKHREQIDALVNALDSKWHETLEHVSTILEVD